MMYVKTLHMCPPLPYMCNYIYTLNKNQSRKIVNTIFQKLDRYIFTNFLNICIIEMIKEVLNIN